MDSPQDTAKAFDTVNLEMLERALNRIKISKRMIKLIIYLFREREVRVITENGLTNPIKAGDGIDQGETISLYFGESSMIPTVQNTRKSESRLHNGMHMEIQSPNHRRENYTAEKSDCCIYG
jgi:Reverse transcriptase (RNA-dependent DNA polymerase).